MNIELIKQRKKLYGNNFPCIAEKWNKFLNINIDELEPNDVAIMMMLMKECRQEYIVEKLDDEMLTDEERKELLNALKDTQEDLKNYTWIAINYDEYEKI